ncbi:unnamed protein product, partial [Ectocarpus fasciculatus]
MPGRERVSLTMRYGISLLACCCFLFREASAFVPATRVGSSLQHHAAGSRASSSSSSRRTVSKMQAELAAEVDTINVAAEGDGKKKVVVIGAGWAGLAAAYELS